MNKDRFYKLTESEKDYLEHMLDRWSDTSGLPEIERTIIDRMFQPALLLNGMTSVDTSSIVEEVSDPFSRSAPDELLAVIEATQTGDGPQIEYTPVPDLTPKHVRQSSNYVLEIDGEENIDFFVPDPNSIVNEESFSDAIQVKQQQVWIG